MQVFIAVKSITVMGKESPEAFFLLFCLYGEKSWILLPPQGKKNQSALRSPSPSYLDSSQKINDVV